jgi:hypothetical protein
MRRRGGGGKTMTAYDDILTPEVRFHLIRKMERHKVIALTGPTLLAHERKYLEFHDVAGVILFERNVQSLAQVSELIASVAECLSASALAPLVAGCRPRRWPSPPPATSTSLARWRARRAPPCASWA